MISIFENKELFISGKRLILPITEYRSEPVEAHPLRI